MAFKYNYDRMKVYHAVQREAKEMRTEEKHIRWCILGAIGGIFMAAGDWLLGCIPIQPSDTGMFNRAYYLSGSYGLWRPVLIVGLGAIGGFLYYFTVKALNADIDSKYGKTKLVQYLCGIFTVAVALAIHTWSATLAWLTAYLGPRIGAEAAVTAYQNDMLAAILPMYIPMVLMIVIHFVMLIAGKTRYPGWMLVFSSGHIEYSARCHPRYCTGHARARGHMDVGHEPEQHQQLYIYLVHSGRGLWKEAHAKPRGKMMGHKLKIACAALLYRAAQAIF